MRSTSARSASRPPRRCDSPWERMAWISYLERALSRRFSLEPAAAAARRACGSGSYPVRGRRRVAGSWAYGSHRGMAHACRCRFVDAVGAFSPAPSSVRRVLTCSVLRSGVPLFIAIAALCGVSIGPSRLPQAPVAFPLRPEAGAAIFISCFFVFVGPCVVMIGAAEVCSYVLLNSLSHDFVHFYSMIVCREKIVVFVDCKIEAMMLLSW